MLGFLFEIFFDFGEDKMKLLHMQNFSCGYIKNIDLDIYSGEIILLAGPNFSGKSNLLKSMKKNLCDKHSGILNYFVDDKKISYVSQNPDAQLILSTVLNELLFTMENLQFDNFTMNKRLVECVNFFGIADLLDKDINELSGGQKQLIVLCSAIIVRPAIVLLDDGFSQLDIVVQNNLLNLIKLMRDEFDITFVIASSNLDNIIQICTRMIFLCDGKLYIDDSISKSLTKLFSSPFKSFLPLIPKLSIENGFKQVCMNAHEFNKLNSGFKKDTLNLTNLPNSKNVITKSIIRIENVSYKYENKFVINNLSWNIEHKINCLMGANGCGKTTLLKLIAGFIKPYCGRIKISSRNIKYMPQNVTAVFDKLTFDKQITNCKNKKFILELLDMFNISFALHENIYELSQSCQQILAFIYIIADEPDILLLDEPTKFLDKNNIEIMKKIINDLDSIVIIAAHNTEFAAQIADRCIMLFNGSIAYEQDAYDFFSDNSFYTLPINKISGQK